MPEFKSKEEYEKWKAQRHGQKQAQNNRPQGDFTPPTDITTPSTVKKPLFRVSLIFILLIVLGVSLYGGYLKYEKTQTQQIPKKELPLVIQKFRELESALTVSLNQMSYNDRLINIRIELDKFENAHKGTVEQQLIEGMLLLEKAFQAYSDGKNAWGQDDIALTNWKGESFSWVDNLIQKYPLIKNKIKTHNFYISKKAEIHDTFHDLLSEKDMERLIGDTLDVQIMNTKERLAAAKNEAVGAANTGVTEMRNEGGSEISTYTIQEISRSAYKDIVWAYASDYTKKAELLFQ
jgi:hypothetical protein